MMLRYATRLRTALLAAIAWLLPALSAVAQVDAEQVMRIGRNTLYFEDYILSIQYFNQAIGAKPWLAQPYFYRAIAKLNLDDYLGAEADATLALERNPFITDAWEVRGVARQNLGNYTGAIADYNRALQDMPDARGLLYNKAMAEQQMGANDSSRVTMTRLVRANPSFDAGYTARARLSMLEGDTVAALADIDRAIALNPDGINAYVIRADIRATRSDSTDIAGALADMDRAIRLQPREPGLFINRAFLRHRADDYYGAMADLDYAVTLDPTNADALTNRALLRAEVHDTNRAVDDLNAVVALRPGDYRALFNRAILLRELGELDAALTDLDRLIAVLPDFAAAYFLRGEVKGLLGMTREGKADEEHSLALARDNVTLPAQIADPASAAAAEMTQQEVEMRMRQLVEVAPAAANEEYYNSADIKGRVQDRTGSVELIGVFDLTYYTSPDELNPSGSRYLRAVDDLNAELLLPFLLQLTAGRTPAVDEEMFERHTASISTLTQRITERPVAVDLFARGMDYMTLRDYAAAASDFTTALTLAPDFTLALLARSLARFHGGEERRAAVADLDELLDRHPEMGVAWYNRGVMLALSGDLTTALSAFNRALELEPAMGEAYYNRGYVYLSLGDRARGLADLSRAGELGILPSYSLLKRMR